MAERCIPTNLLFATVSNRLKDAEAPALGYLSLCKESMSGYSATTTTFGSEVTRVAVTPTIEKTTVDNDTITLTKASWEPGANTIYGAGIFTASTGENLQAFHEWAASITFAAGDMVNETIKIQSKLGS